MRPAGVLIVARPSPGGRCGPWSSFSVADLSAPPPPVTSGDCFVVKGSARPARFDCCLKKKNPWEPHAPILTQNSAKQKTLNSPADHEATLTRGMFTRWAAKLEVMTSFTSVSNLMFYASTVISGPVLTSKQFDVLRPVNQYGYISKQFDVLRPVNQYDYIKASSDQ